jgi:hypothetical protein
MKSTIAKAGCTVAIVGVLVLLALAFLAYSVTSHDPSTGLWHDGLGRPLSDSPWFMRLIFGTDHQWAGWTWFLVDMGVFWGWIGLCTYIAKRADKA